MASQSALVGGLLIRVLEGIFGTSFEAPFSG